MLYSLVLLWIYAQRLFINSMNLIVDFNAYFEGESCLDIFGFVIIEQGENLSLKFPSQILMIMKQMIMI